MTMMRIRLARHTASIAFVLLLTTAALAGCLGPEDDLLPAVRDTIPGFDGSYTFGLPIAYNETLAVRDPALIWGAGEAPRFMQTLLDGSGGEPNIGVTSSGAVFMTNGDNIERSLDHGRTWEVVHDFESPNVPETEDQFGTGDPMLWVDRDTDRVYLNHMYPSLTCSYLAWSDDDGETWTDRPFYCGTGYPFDHQKIMTAPHGPAATTALFEPTDDQYPNVLYMCYNKLALGTWCAMSHDGGMTVAYEAQLAPLDKACGAINGHPAAFPDGSVAVAFGGFAGGGRCARPVTVAVTEDDGVTWQERKCAWGYKQAEIDPDITVTPDGTAYLLFRNTEDQLVYMLRSTDKFQTCDVFRIAPEDHTINVFTVIQAGMDGHLAMAYLGTADPQDLNTQPSNARQGSVWHLYVTTSRNAGDEEPVFHTQRVTPDEDPVQIGCIWLSGGAGGPFQCRNLLDFIDMTIDDEGRLYVAITDGCTPRQGCTGTPQHASDQTRDRQNGVMIQAEGLSLLDPARFIEPLPFSWPMPDPSVYAESDDAA